MLLSFNSIEIVLPWPRNLLTEWKNKNLLLARLIKVFRVPLRLLILLNITNQSDKLIAFVKNRSFP